MNNAMLPILASFGVKEGVDLSEFCCNYDDIVSLKKRFVEYMPNKRSYKEMDCDDIEGVPTEKTPSVEQVTNLLSNINGDKTDNQKKDFEEIEMDEGL